MMRSRFRVLPLLAALLLIMPLFATVSAQEVATPAPVSPGPPPLAEAMPATVQAYVATQFDLDTDQFGQATGLLTRMLIPGAGDTIAGIVEKIAGLIGVLPDGAVDVLEGDVGIGIQGFQPLDLQDASDTASLVQSVLPGYAIVLHPKKAGDARQIIEAWFTDQLQEKGLSPTREEIGSTVVLRNPDPSTASFATSPAVVVFAGDYIFLGDDYDEMLPFIEASQGDAPTLADATELDRLQSALPSERLLFGYISGETMTESAAGIFNASTLAEAIDPPFGATAFTVAADKPGFRFESVSLPVQGTDLGAGTTTTANPDFAAQLPESTLAMFAGNDLGESWLMAQVQKVLLSVLMSSLGAGEIDLTDTDVGMQFGMLAMLTGINFKTDLMDQLSGTYGAALFSLDTDDPLGSSAVVASGLTDVDRVSVGVTSLGPLLQSVAPADMSITTASVEGQTVNNVTLLGDDQTATIQYGVVNDQLMVGLGDGLPTLAQGPESSLDENAGYQAGLAELPSSYNSVIYVDVESIARQLAPYLIDQFAAGSDSAIAQCLVRSAVSDGTPVPSVKIGGTAGAICSVLDMLLGDNWLQNFIVSRIPGPFTAVAYQDDGLQHISGILLVGAGQ